MMSRKDRCKGCIWAERLNEKTTFCPYARCVKKGGGEDEGQDGTADGADVLPGPGNPETAAEPDT